MISTSDGETYEDSIAHALGVKQPVTASSSTASRVPRQAPTEPAGEFKSEQATPVAGNEKKLYIIRHGSTDMNQEGNTSADRIRGWQDIPLNDEGRQDAEKAGQKLAQMEPPTIMHHSDLDRASETAGIISKHIDIPTTASRNLRPWDLGELTGTATKEAIPQIEDYVKNKPDQAVPKGESFNEFKDRAFKGIHAALDSGDSPVAIVTHHRLERLLEAWNAKGQPADHSIDLETFIQKGDPPGGVKEMMVHQLEQQPDMVQKIIRATIQHFKNSFMEGPNLMKDFMEGKVTSEDEDAIRRAMGVAWKGTPISKTPLKVDNPEDIANYDELANWYKRDPELSVGLAFERAGKIPPTSDLKDVKPSENIVERGQHEFPRLGSKEYKYDTDVMVDQFRGEDLKNPLRKAAGVNDIANRVTEGIVRMKNKEMAKKAKIMKY